ncbi:MAG: hypothetical protein WCT39_06225, partial [Candidatus Margulisiibacteriota bacterium]
TEFNQMKDTANKQVFDLSLKELRDVREALANKASEKQGKKEKLLVILLARLKEESGLEGSVPLSC